MEELEVGEYVKTKNGIIGQVVNIEKAWQGTRYAGEFLTDNIITINDGKVYDRRIKDKNIVKHSKNLIDLIEVGDIVNKEYMSSLIDIYVRFIRDGHKIKTILTHEQYMQNCYKVDTN